MDAEETATGEGDECGARAGGPQGGEPDHGPQLPGRITRWMTGSRGGCGSRRGCGTGCQVGVVLTVAGWDKSGVGVAGAGIDELEGPADAGECEDGAGGIREGGGRGR